MYYVNPYQNRIETPQYWIEKWKDKLEYLGIDYTSFQEPDLKNQTTSLAVLGNEKLFKNLKLIK